LNFQCRQWDLSRGGKVTSWFDYFSVMFRGNII
jgi:hypothetical protein